MVTLRRSLKYQLDKIMDCKVSEKRAAQAAPLMFISGSHQTINAAKVMIVAINAIMMIVTSPSARNARLRNELIV